MKGLKKGVKDEFIKRFQKPKQDLVQIMNTIEAKQISTLIGIGENEMERMSGFFQQVRKIKLPKGYVKYLNSSKTQVIYENKFLQISQNIHPSLNLIKLLFYQILSNNKSVYTFEAKQRKLLPFVEDKMMRQAVAINSKRRDAQKVNLQRDENGKMVLSKLKRVTPDIAPLIGTRSYLLKMLIEKVYTKRQIWGKGKRANAYLSILSHYHNKIKSSEPQRDDEDTETELSLEKYEKIFQESQKFYDEQFGELNHIPKSVMKSEEYIRGTPQNVLRNTYILNISKDSLQLFWLARMMDCLPLPPHWHLKLGSSYSEYVYEPEDLTFQIHPSYIYIIKQISKFRTKYLKMEALQQNYYNNMRQMIFYDYFQRPYKVDIYHTINHQEQQNFYGNKNKKTKKVNKNASLISADWMIMEGIRNSKFTESAYTLISSVEAYWLSLDFAQQTYAPSISPYGQIIWSSNITGRCIDYCPFRQEITSLIDNEMIKLPQFVQSDFKIEQRFSEEDSELYILFREELPKQRQNFLKYFITHQQLPLPWPYQTSNANFFEENFTSPFNLQSDLQFQPHDQPLWLEKVRAKKMINKYRLLLNKSQFYFNQLLNQFKQYAFESTKNHQPNRLDQVQLKLSNIKNKHEFLKVVSDFNDIEAREQRKRRNKEISKNQDEDIFGSSLSNIDIDELKDDSDQQSKNEIVEIQSESSSQQVPIIQQSSSEEQVVEKTQSQESSQQHEVVVQVKKQQVKIIKKKYQKNKQIQRLSEGQLNKQLKDLQKKQSKKHKYSANDKFKVKFKVQEKQGNRIQKQNIIISDNRTAHLPYKTNNFHKILIKKEGKNNNKYNRNAMTPFQVVDQSASFTPFQSEMSQYANDEVIKEIQKWQSTVLKKDNPENENDKKMVQRKQADETSHTIVLEPIKRTKPLIQEDPILIHFQNLSSVAEFRKTFVKTDSKDTQNTLRKNLSMKTISNLKSQTMPKKVLEPIKSVQKFKNIPESGIFQRICLQNTAQHLLSKNAIIKRGDLISLQARKTLISKGRGLQTYMSQKY